MLAGKKLPLIKSIEGVEKNCSGRQAKQFLKTRGWMTSFIQCVTMVVHEKEFLLLDLDSIGRKKNMRSELLHSKMSNLQKELKDGTCQLEPVSCTCDPGEEGAAF